MHLSLRLLSRLAAPALLLCLALFAPLAVGSAAAAQGRFVPAPCWFTPPEGEAVLCGTVAVPERRDRPSPRTLHLAVAVLRSTAAKPAADPVIFIEGGPGASPFGFGELGEERMESWWELSAPFRRTRDFVLFDPRGVGRSEPDTNCTELDGMAGAPRARTLTRTVVEAAERVALEACSARLRASGIDLATFTTPAAVDDVADIAAALGATRFNLFAVSYGTRVALDVLRRHGSRVRALVLDAVYPPDVNAAEEEAWLARRALRRLFDDCTANRSCRAAFPNLERRFLDLAARLDAAPAEVSVGDPLVPLTVRLDGAALLAAVLEAMAEDEPIPRLPALIDRAARGRLERLAQYVPTSRLGDPDTAEGMAFSIECRETVNAADPTRTTNNRRRWTVLPGAGTDEPGKRVCAVWPAGVPEPIERLPVASTVPALLFSGAYDPVTPPEWGERAARTLPQSRHMVFRASGHVVTAGEPCALDAAAAFIKRPDPAKLPACPAADKPPMFELR
ncbi:MAG TPA: alpha/beta hydrolase [Azospirillum sp.]|nr:alpha/beta hydrolase [Azospirillum sp.]